MRISWCTCACDRIRRESGKGRLAARAAGDADPDGDLTPEEFHTPDRKTIAEVAAFTGSARDFADQEPGDGGGRQARACAASRRSFAERDEVCGRHGWEGIRPAHPEEIRQWFGADAGSLGPVGVKNMRMIADLALQGRRNMIAGANKNDYHLRNVTPGEDFKPEFYDLRQVAHGDTEMDTRRAAGDRKTVEIGHIFKLGYKYSEAMGLKVLNEAGEEVTVIMGSYGIGVGANSVRGDRTVSRQGWHVAAGVDRAVSKW